jgi:hypothetical protein
MDERPRLFPVRNPRNFEDWVSNQFGKRLLQHILQKLHRKSLGHELQRRFPPTGLRSASKDFLSAVPLKNALIPQRYNGDRTKGH